MAAAVTVGIAAAGGVITAAAAMAAAVGDGVAAAAAAAVAAAVGDGVAAAAAVAAAAGALASAVWPSAGDRHPSEPSDLRHTLADIFLARVTRITALLGVCCLHA